MKMSNRGLAELAGHEGIVTSRYKCSAGVWTIGVGHTAAAGPPDPAKCGAISLDEALHLFRQDVASYEHEVAQAVRVPLEPHEFDALVSFHYNTGAIRLAGLTRALNAGDREKAAERFMAWRKPAEIIPRRRLEQKLFRHGIYSHGGEASVYPANRAGGVAWASGKRIQILSLIETGA